MTGSDEPFKRPSLDTDPATSEPPSGNNAPRQADAPATPVVLDPAFHEPVWKPWDVPADPQADAEESVHVAGTAPLREPGATARRVATGWTSVIAGIIVLVLAMMLPSAPPRGLDGKPVPVQDMPSLPALTWSAEGGDTCGSLDPDHAIFYDSRRVWSLDLRDGREKWSVALEVPIADVVCLVGSDAVAVTENSAAGEPFNTTLLDGSTGESFATLPSSAATQVIPLGEGIGLVSPESTLSMVNRTRLDSPLWTRDFPDPPMSRLPIATVTITEDAVHLYYVTGSPSASRNIVLSLKDGSVPPWFDTSDATQPFYLATGDTFLRAGPWAGRGKLTALNAEGVELWSTKMDRFAVSGDSLYVFEDNGFLREAEVTRVDPRTGTRMGENIHSGLFYAIVGTGSGRLATIGIESVTFLDDALHPITSLEGADVALIAEGTNQTFVAVDTDTNEMAEKVRLTAVSSKDLSVQWTLDLEARQYVEHMGRHLVVRQRADNTLHGLGNP